MPYSYLLVAVAPMPESQILIKEAVPIARSVNIKASFITFVMDPEMYNQSTASMMENLCEPMQEEAWEPLDGPARQTGYLIEKMTIACGKLGHHIKGFCQPHKASLAICGNHNHSLSPRVTCSAKNIVGSNGIDILLVSLEKG